MKTEGQDSASRRREQPLTWRRLGFHPAAFRSDPGRFGRLSALSVVLSEPECESIPRNPPVPWKQPAARSLYVCNLLYMLRCREMTIPRRWEYGYEFHHNISDDQNYLFYLLTSSFYLDYWLLISFSPACLCRSYNGWHRDAHSLRTWALRWDASCLFLSFCISLGFFFLSAVKEPMKWDVYSVNSWVILLCVQFFTQSLCGPYSRDLQISGSVRSGSLGPGLLCPLVRTLSTLCPGVWGPSSGVKTLLLCMNLVAFFLQWLMRQTESKLLQQTVGRSTN